MNTIELQENISFETYQKIVKYIRELGVKIQNDTIPFELTKEDLKNIEISHLQAEKGEVLESAEVFEKLRKRYES